MCSLYNYQAACKKARELGAFIEADNGWNLAKGFPSAEVAWHFQTEFTGMESHGAYPENSGSAFTVIFR